MDSTSTDSRYSVKLSPEAAEDMRAEIFELSGKLHRHVMQREFVAAAIAVARAHPGQFRAAIETGDFK
jgi:hypothetical protein